MSSTKRTGRPTKYNEKMLKIAQDYVAKFSGDIKPGLDFYDVPMIAELELLMGVCRDTIHTWANDPKKAEFSDTIRELHRRQEMIILKTGMNGLTVPRFAQFLLSANHNYKEKTENVNKNEYKISDDHKKEAGKMFE